MKLWMSEDEKFPHVFAQGKPHNYWGEYDVPDDLGQELLDLRQRESKLLELIAKHLRDTGQPAAFDVFGD